MAISNLVRSWLFLIPLIPSVVVSVFDLYYFLSNRALRTALNNHAIILLLIFGFILELTDISWQIHYYRTGTVLFSTSTFCFTWIFIGSTIYISIFILMGWASIERHILIFYPNWFASKTKCFFFHYIPLCICIMCPVIFYFVIFFILPCDIIINYNRRFCSLQGCIIIHFIPALWDSIVNYIMPAFITVIFSVSLFVRVLYHRYRVRQRIEWRKYKKLAVQLLPISILYILLQFPPIILYVAYSAGLSRTIATDYFSDTFYFMRWVILFTPFACALSLPELRIKCRNVLLFWQRKHNVSPMVLTYPKVAKKGTIVPTIQ